MKAVIVVAGWGTRMLPLTKTIPKEMLPVGDKPVIHHIVEQLVRVGIHDIIFIVSKHKQALVDYFGSVPELENLLLAKQKYDMLASVTLPAQMAYYRYVYQDEQLGTAHAVAQVQELISEDHFMVVFGDAIYPPSMYDTIIQEYDRYGQSMMLTQEVPYDQTHKYGVVEYDMDTRYLTALVEKPAPGTAKSNLISNGVYVLPKEIFLSIAAIEPDAKSGEYQLPNAIEHRMQSDPVRIVITQSMRDIGNLDWRLAANVYFSQHGKLF